MEVDDEDDFYSPEPSSAKDNAEAKTEPTEAGAVVPKQEEKTELEEGEEEDEGGAMDEDDDDSDIDIITERKDGTKAAPPPQARYNDIKNIPQRSTADDLAAKPAPASKSPTTKAETPTAPLAVPSADKVAAAASSSKIDVNGNPIHTPTGKRITAVNIDEDLGENEKPWRKPGTDISDYFNYGFDEFTWALYASKQESMRSDFSAENMNKKMMEDLGGMMMMGGMGMPGAGGSQGGGGGAGGMPGMEGMPPEMQAMMQQMMSSGMDPSQMDPASLSAMFGGMQNQGGNPGAQGGQGQNFGGQGGFGGGNQGQYGGYDQQAMGGGGRGGFGGRGRGGRRW